MPVEGYGVSQPFLLEANGPQRRQLHMNGHGPFAITQDGATIYAIRAVDPGSPRLAPDSAHLQGVRLVVDTFQRTSQGNTLLANVRKVGDTPAYTVFTAQTRQPLYSIQP